MGTAKPTCISPSANFSLSCRFKQLNKRKSLAAIDPKYKILWWFTITFGLIAALLGLLLRFYFIQPLGFNFKFVLHAHSHLMLLGWLFNALLLLLYQQWFEKIPKNHFFLFLLLQLCVFGMLCSFPFQGYALFSIIFSTLHIWASYVLLWKFWKHSRGHGFEGQLVRIGIIFHFLSTLGPYSLGPLIANGFRGSGWYDQAIYFYLHFQYNGSFFFFFLALIWQFWKKNQAQMKAKLFLWLMGIGAVLTWAHSLEYSFYFWWINAAGLLGSFLQLGGGIMLFQNLDRRKVSRNGLIILSFIALKWLFQLLGSAPEIGEFVSQQRFLLIAYLHFIFLGIYTPFIWQRLLPHKAAMLKNFYWIFFLSTELILACIGAGVIPASFVWLSILFSVYALLIVCWSGLAYHSK